MVVTPCDRWQFGRGRSHRRRDWHFVGARAPISSLPPLSGHRRPVIGRSWALSPCEHGTFRNAFASLIILREKIPKSSSVFAHGRYSAKMPRCGVCAASSLVLSEPLELQQPRDSDMQLWGPIPSVMAPGLGAQLPAWNVAWSGFGHLEVGGSNTQAATARRSEAQRSSRRPTVSGWTNFPPSWFGLYGVSLPAAATTQSVACEQAYFRVGLGLSSQSWTRDQGSRIMNCLDRFALPPALADLQIKAGAVQRQEALEQTSKLRADTEDPCSFSPEIFRGCERRPQTMSSCFAVRKRIPVCQLDSTSPSMPRN